MSQNYGYSGPQGPQGVGVGGGPQGTMGGPGGMIPAQQQQMSQQGIFITIIEKFLWKF